MRKTCSSLLLLLLGSGYLKAQDSLWTLERSIQYAVTHNLDIKQNELNERLARLQLQQNQLARIPSASISTNAGRSYGRSIDPTTNSFINEGYTFYGLNGNVDVLLFGWFQRKNTIDQSRLLSNSAKADLDQLKNDISLNVATAFLRILLAQAQIGVAENQLRFSLKQQEQAAYFVKAGRSPELDLAQMQSQVATDSSAYITAVATYQQSLLDMKALMNFDISAIFVPVAPDVSDVSLAEVGTMDPEQVYATARAGFGSIKSGRLKIDAARKSLSVAKGGLYPQLSVSGQLGTNYSSLSTEFVPGSGATNYAATGLLTNVGGVYYDVLQPVASGDSRAIPFGNQLNTNFRQTVALSLSIPLLNGWSARTAVNRARIDVMARETELSQTALKLRQDVYKAYYDATAAVQKYYATARAQEASDRAYDYAQKRYELGLMNAVELLTTQNTSFKAKTDALSAKYDMVFKLKVIDYYLGKEIKL